MLNLVYSKTKSCKKKVFTFLTFFLRGVTLFLVCLTNYKAFGTYTCMYENRYVQQNTHETVTHNFALLQPGGKE